MDYLKVAKDLERQGKIKQSAVYYVKAYDVLGDASLAVKAGELYSSIGSFKQASTVFGLVEGNGNSIIYEKIIDVCLRSGNYNSAIQYFTTYFSSCPRIKKLAFANTLLKKKRYLEAEGLFLGSMPTKFEKRVSSYQIRTDSQIPKCLPSRSAKNVSRANSLFDDGNYRKAQRLYLRDIKKTEYCKIRFAECYLQLGDYQRAIRVYSSLFKSTQNGYYALMIGECFRLSQSDLEQAVNWYEVALNHQCIYANYSLGYCYQRGVGAEVDLNRAKAFYEVGTNSQKDQARCYLGLGSIASQMGNTKQANDYYKAVLKCDDADALYDLASHHFNGLATGLTNEQVICCLAKSAAHGNLSAVKAYQMLKITSAK